MPGFSFLVGPPIELPALFLVELAACLPLLVPVFLVDRLPGTLPHGR